MNAELVVIIGMAFCGLLFALLGWSFAKDAIFYKQKKHILKPGQHINFSFDFGPSQDSLSVTNLVKLSMTAISVKPFTLTINGNLRESSYSPEHIPLSWEHITYHEITLDTCHEVILRNGSQVKVRFTNSSNKDVEIVEDLKRTYRKRYLTLGIMMLVMGALCMSLLSTIPYVYGI
jgi:hypothetical protein